MFLLVCFVFKSYPVNGLGDEDFNIPPITPPTLPDHMLPPHLPHDSSGLYHSVEPPSSSAPHHHPYQLQGVELSGMPGRQDGADSGTFSPGGGPMTSTLSVVSTVVPKSPHLSPTSKGDKVFTHFCLCMCLFVILIKIRF